MRPAARGSYTVFPTPSSGLEGRGESPRGAFIVVVGAFLQARIEPGARSKSLCIEPCGGCPFGVRTPPHMRCKAGGFGLLSDHEMHDHARPSRSEYRCVPTVGLPIGKPCQRRQHNERYTNNYRPGSRNVSKQPRAFYEQITNQTRQRVAVEPDRRYVNCREKLVVRFEGIGQQRH
jgi:hypothetical protein